MKWAPEQTPLSDARLASLAAGDALLLSGTLLTARDQAHRRIEEMTRRGEALPVALSGELIYFMGPSPAPPGRAIGAAGPTTSSRMDRYTETMLSLGVRGFIGKGRRSPETKELIRRRGAVYFVTFGGAAAYLGMRIIAAEPVAFADLGPEAVYRLTVRDFPIIVAYDLHGGDLYEAGIRGPAGI
ncbi:MAG TPA: FumA C-terminus/TtdB family hydratase beta subunit [Spirochaetota bacterium]|nr:FumA C-terminus/TtdB family hydratase beta subunit [Spirochaetota bacterium]HNT10120.1 FumA C-terminus/TtdB family hydratase beta subunit [Spirochaetota bacterium]HNV47269.1 FumA C-terminus/TtdB family hydratase beta subunit [Spirochaetota bacterium]HPU86937.1 FumA C-terminus/TtdB family hydratase beta subunit [Spirochaetota bacterium]